MDLSTCHNPCLNNYNCCNEWYFRLSKLLILHNKKFLDLSKSEFTITAMELQALKKFLFIMSFRHPYRRQQYIEGRFDGSTRAFQQEYGENQRPLLCRGCMVGKYKDNIGVRLLAFQDERPL